MSDYELIKLAVAAAAVVFSAGLSVWAIRKSEHHHRVNFIAKVVTLTATQRQELADKAQRVTR